MNSRERMDLAMHHQQPDRVPVMCQLACGHYFLYSGIQPEEIWFTSEGFAEALVRMQRRYRFDGILINIPGRPAGWLERNVSKVRRDDDGQWLTLKSEDRVFIPNDDNAQFYPASETEAYRADFESIDPDDLGVIDGLKGYVWGTEHIPWIEGKQVPGPLSEIPPYFFDTIDAVRRRVGNEVSVHGEVFSPLTHYMELFGYEQALMTFIQDPGKVHAILDRLSRCVGDVGRGPGASWRGCRADLLGICRRPVPFAAHVQGVCGSL